MGTETRTHTLDTDGCSTISINISIQFCCKILANHFTFGANEGGLI